MLKPLVLYFIIRSYDDSNFLIIIIEIGDSNIKTKTQIILRLNIKI